MGESKGAASTTARGASKTATVLEQEEEGGPRMRMAMMAHAGEKQTHKHARKRKEQMRPNSGEKSQGKVVVAHLFFFLSPQAWRGRER